MSRRCTESPQAGVKAIASCGVHHIREHLERAEHMPRGGRHSVRRLRAPGNLPRRNTQPVGIVQNPLTRASRRGHDGSWLVGASTRLRSPGGDRSRLATTLSVGARGRGRADRHTGGDLVHPRCPRASPNPAPWLEGIDSGTGRSAAAFDTRIGKPKILTGSAAHKIAQRLRRHGYEVVGEESFIVEDTAGPLREGERDRAVEWGPRTRHRLTRRAARQEESRGPDMRPPDPAQRRVASHPSKRQRGRCRPLPVRQRSRSP